MKLNWTPPRSRNDRRNGGNVISDTVTTMHCNDIESDAVHSSSYHQWICWGRTRTSAVPTDGDTQAMKQLRRVLHTNTSIPERSVFTNLKSFVCVIALEAPDVVVIFGDCWSKP